MLFTINQFYIIVGILLATIAIFTLLDKNHPKRLSSQQNSYDNIKLIDGK
jgi:uncharacterized membrane protein